MSRQIALVKKAVSTAASASASASSAKPAATAASAAAATLPEIGNGRNIRDLPVNEMLLRLKNGPANVPLPQLKKLELHYYQDHSELDVRRFVTQHAPALAYANPTLPFIIKRLGTRLRGNSPAAKEALKKLAEHNASVASAARAKSKSKSQSSEALEEIESDESEDTLIQAVQSPESTASALNDIIVDFGKVSPEEASEMAYGKGVEPNVSSYPPYQLVSTADSEKPIFTLMEDGKTILRKGQRLPALLFFDFHTRDPITARTQLEGKILNQIISTANQQAAAPAKKVASKKQKAETSSE